MTTTTTTTTTTKITTTMPRTCNLILSRYMLSNRSVCPLVTTFCVCSELLTYEKNWVMKMIMMMMMMMMAIIMLMIMWWHRNMKRWKDLLLIHNLLTFPLRTYQSMYYLGTNWWFFSGTNGWFQCVIYWVKSLMNSFLLLTQCKHVFIGHEIGVCTSKRFDSL